MGEAAPRALTEDGGDGGEGVCRRQRHDAHPARDKGQRFMLMDATAAMLMRPDGHPSRYGHWPNEKVQLYNDCIQWCLPGPIDIWNDMLFQMLLA